MNRTAWFLILIGIVLKVRGFVVFYGAADMAAVVKVGEPGSDERKTAQLQLFADALASGVSALEWSGLFIGLGLIMLIGRWIWKATMGHAGGIKALELRQRRFHKRR